MLKTCVIRLTFLTFVAELMKIYEQLMKLYTPFYQLIPTLRKVGVKCSKRWFYLQLPDADSQVWLIKSIGYIPTKGPKFSSLLNKSMEKTNAKEQFLPHLWEKQNKQVLLMSLYAHASL